MSYFFELLINGALTGLMYAMVALGIVLIYKSSGVLNFAQGALVMMGGYAVWLFTSWDCRSGSRPWPRSPRCSCSASSSSGCCCAP